MAFFDDDSELPPWRDGRDHRHHATGFRRQEVTPGPHGPRRPSFGHAPAPAPWQEPLAHRPRNPPSGWRTVEVSPPRHRRPSLGHAPRPEPAEQRRDRSPHSGFRVVDVSPPRHRRPSFGYAPRPERAEQRRDRPPPSGFRVFELEPRRERRPSVGHAPRPEAPRQRRASHGQAEAPREGRRSRRASFTQTIRDIFRAPSKDRHGKDRAPSHDRHDKHRAPSHDRHGKDRPPSHAREHRREHEREHRRGEQGRDGVPRPPITRHGRPPRPSPQPDNRRREAEPRRKEVKAEIVSPDMERRTEGLNRYQEGGNYPTHIGDRIGPRGDEDRYRIVHKLGNGSYGIAWLVEDTRDRKEPWKALKINDAGPGGESEVRLQKMFEDVGYTGRKALDNQIAVPYELFWITGPNGRHLISILPILGPTLEKLAEDPKLDISRRALVRQLIIACDFLHNELGIMHGDFRCGNIMLQVEGLQQLNENEMYDVYNGTPQIIPFENIENGLISPKRAPKYLVVSPKFRLDKLIAALRRKTGTKAYSTTRPKLAVADLGSAKHSSEQKPWQHVCPVCMIDPMVYFNQSAYYPSDTFSMGVSIFEIMTGGNLFRRGRASCRDVWRDYFPNIEETIGPFPVELRKATLKEPPYDFVLARWPRGIPAEFRATMNPKKPFFRTEEEQKANFKAILGNMRGAKNPAHGLLLSKGLDAKEADAIWSLILACCQWRQENRSRVEEIMRHPLYVKWDASFARSTGKGPDRCLVQ